MKYIVLSFISFFIPFLLVTNSNAQDNLLQLTREVTKTIDAPENKNFHLKYIQTSTTRDRMDLPQSIEVELKRVDNKLWMTSAHMDVFVDKADAFIVYKEAKRIFVTKDIQSAKNQMKGGSILKAMEMLWQTAAITEITPSIKSETRTLKIVPSDNMKQASQVERVDISFNRSTKKMEKVTLYMEQKSNIKKVEYDYLIIEKDVNLNLFDNARSEIYNSSGNIHKKYKGYSIQHF